MINVKKILSFILITTFTFGGLFGCTNGNSDTSKDSRVIGACLAQTNITAFGNHLYLDLVEMCKDNGWELICMDAERDSTKEAQNVDTLLLHDIDVFVYWPYDKEAALVNVKKVKDAGLPVVLMNADIPEEGWEDTDAYIGPDQIAMSSEIGEYFVEKLGGSANVAIIDGTPGTTQYLLRMEGLESVFAENPGMNIIAHDYCMGDRAEAITMAENFLTTYGEELDAIYCPAGDNSAVGIAQTLHDAGRGDILVGSNDGMAEAFKLINAGYAYVTALQKPQFQIDKLEEVAEQIFAGNTIENRTQHSRFVILSSENISSESPEY